jgi:transcription initiation factor TFIIIB Brf1 subunit/transcription initiation factor TFIIB
MKKTPEPILKFRRAKVPHMFDNIRVVLGSDEKIFEETYVTGIMQNNRVVKFKKSSLEFLND